VVDAKAIDQAISYLLMFAALFVTYFAHWSVLLYSAIIRMPFYSNVICCPNGSLWRAAATN
jgi:hypothetical protein